MRRLLDGKLLLLLFSGAQSRTLILDPAGSDQNDCISTPCQTLLYAMQQALSGDTIELGPGIYSGPGNRNLDPGAVGKANLTIQGRDGFASTKLDFQGQGRGFLFTAAAGQVVLQRLTLLNGACAQLPPGSRHGAGISLENATATLLDLWILNMDCSNSNLIYGGEFSGAGIFSKDSQSLIRRVEISDCVANHGGGLATWGAERSVVEDSTFSRHVGTKWGGAMLVEENSQTIFRRCRFTGSSSSYGAHIDDGGTAAGAFYDCTFENGYSSLYGGSYYAFGSTRLQFYNCLFANNFAAASAGAVWLNADNMPYFYNATFRNNSAISGGAIRSQYSGSSGFLTFIKTQFIGNSATSDGGAVKGANSLLFVDCTFSGNSADAGGALLLTAYYGPGLGTVVRTSLFQGNVASSGAAINTFMDSSSDKQPLLFLNQSTFINNSATGLASWQGGGALMFSSTHTVLILSSKFHQNSAAGFGGAVLFAPAVSSSLVINYTEFVGNAANAGGGALSCTQTASTVNSLTLFQSSIRGSATFGDGAAAVLNCGRLALLESEFTGNSASEGSGGAVLFGSFVNCAGGSTFSNLRSVGNTAKLAGGSFFFSSLSVSRPACAIPTVAGDSSVWDSTQPSPWVWGDFGQSVTGNVAKVGSLQATSPVRLRVLCATSSSDLTQCNASGQDVVLTGFIGMELSTFVHLEDSFGQAVLDDTLTLEVVQNSTAASPFILQGLSKVRFTSGTASLAGVQLLASSFPPSPAQLQLLVRLPRALTTLSYVPAVPVALLLGTSASACPAGYVQSQASAAAVLCDPCPGGSFASLAAVQCSTCPTGSYASSPGSSSCRPCPPGHGCPAGTTLPSPCAQGYSQPLGSQERCVQCPQDFFQELEGQANCTACPPGMGTQLQGTISSSLCVCQEGSYMTTVGNLSLCQPCTLGMSCPTGSTAPGQAAGFFLQLDSSGAYNAFRCLSLDCPAGSPGTCAPGRVGLACGRCANGFYPTPDRTCQPCKQVDVVPLLLTSLAGLLFLFFLGFLAKSDISKQSFTVLTALCTAGQSLVAVQIISVLGRLREAWPLAVLALFNAFSIFRFDFNSMRVQCVVGYDSPLGRYFLQIFAFPAVAVLFLLVAGVIRLLGRQLTRADLFNSLGLLLTLCFLPITAYALAPFHCVQNPNGSSSMEQEPSILCGSSVHAGLVSTGIIALLAYPVAVLSGTGFVCLLYPHIIASGGGSMLVRRFRFLFHRFRPERYYYGFFHLVRSFLLTLIPLLSNDARAQIFGFVAVVNGFWGLQCWLQPWRTDTSNLLDASLSFVISALLVAAAALVGSSNAHDNSTISTYVLVCLVLVLCAPCLALLSSLWAWASRKSFGRKYGGFLCHHKGGAASIARYLKHFMESTTGRRVFLDSDELQNLELLFDVVRSDTKCLIVLLTCETLKRPWCAGEIVMAHKKGLPIIPVVCGPFTKPSDAHLASLGSAWSPQELHQLSFMGIGVDDIRVAYRHLVSLEFLEFPTSFSTAADLSTLHDAAMRVVQQCNLRRLPFTGTSGFNPQTGGSSQLSSKLALLVNGKDLQAVSAACVLEEAIQRGAQRETYICLHEMDVAPTVSVDTIIVLLSNGCFEAKDFMKAVLVCIGQWDSAALLTVQADAAFQHPSTSFIENELSPRMASELGVDESALRNAYDYLLQVVAASYSAHLPSYILRAEADVICRRITPEKELETTKQKSNKAKLLRTVKAWRVVQQSMKLSSLLRRSRENARQRRSWLELSWSSLRDLIRARAQEEPPSQSPSMSGGVSSWTAAANPAASGAGPAGSLSFDFGASSSLQLQEDRSECIGPAALVHV